MKSLSPITLVFSVDTKHLAEAIARVKAEIDQLPKRTKLSFVEMERTTEGFREKPKGRRGSAWGDK